MKTSQRAATTAAVIAIGALAPTLCLAQGKKTPSRIPEQPVGIMSAFPTIVQTGTKPTLNWNIMHPSRVGDIAIVNPPGTIIPQQPIYVTVQPIGTGVTDCSSQGHEHNNYYTDARISYSGGSYKQLFYGVMDDVDPAHKLYVKKVFANETIDFGGRFVKSNQWSPFFTTRSSNMQVVALVDGDVPPTTFPLHTSPKLKNYLKPYLDGSGKVRIGPLSILILMELGTTDRSSNCFDYQDQALLVTLSLKHPNNGHGNNLDGVDSSNPGQGSGGPTGLNNSGNDPSGGYDDEIR
ncbi:MAG TPA: hypothetical protein VLO11_14435 [Luteolibacter sp.]|nr:hypothetical protein [Luteolibacter sp.]